MITFLIYLKQLLLIKYVLYMLVLIVGIGSSQ